MISVFVKECRDRILTEGNIDVTKDVHRIFENLRIVFRSFSEIQHCPDIYFAALIEKHNTSKTYLSFWFFSDKSGS